MNIVASLWPVFALLMVGWGLKRSGFPGDAFWPMAERLIYYVCFPALLVTRLAAARFEGQMALDLVWSVLLLLLMASTLLLLLQRVFRFNGSVFTSVFQGGIRFNTYIALAVSAGLSREFGVVYAAIIASVMIPLINVLCVLVFAVYQDNRPSPGQVVRNIFSNPLILGCLLGVTLNLTGVGLASGLAQVLELLAQLALPLALLAVGAALRVRSLGRSGTPLFSATLFRLALMPALALVSGALLNLSSVAMQVLLVFASVPSASAAYILARQLGGDAQLMAGILSAQTLLAMITLPMALSVGMLFYPELVDGLSGILR